MPRDLIASHRTSLEEPAGEDQPLVFIEFTHAELTTSIRVVNDIATSGGAPVQYQFDGKNFTAFPFSVRLLSDDDGPPRGRLEIQNIDQSIGEALREITTPVQLQIWVFVTDEFDLTVNPRLAKYATLTPIWTATSLTLREVEADAMWLSGTIQSLDDTGEPYPGLLTSEALFPGLYR